MALFGVTRKPESLQAYQLTSPSDMLAALTYLADRNYTGTIDCRATVWTLTFQNPERNIGQSAQINDYIVIENGIIASVCPLDNFDTLFNTA